MKEEEVVGDKPLASALLMHQMMISRQMQLRRAFLGVENANNNNNDNDNHHDHHHPGKEEEEMEGRGRDEGGEEEGKEDVKEDDGDVDVRERDGEVEAENEERRKGEETKEGKGGEREREGRRKRKRTPIRGDEGEDKTKVSCVCLSVFKMRPSISILEGLSVRISVRPAHVS